MATIKIARRLEFDYGHRLQNHEGKCRFLHGHRGAADIEVESKQLDGLGRVIDFSFIKDKIGYWIEQNWDHNVILQYGDPFLRSSRFRNNHGREIYVMDDSPTAENLAKHLHEVHKGAVPDGIRISRITLWETPNCCAIYYPPKSPEK